MMIISRAVAWFSMFCRKFFHEGVPVALAGVIGTMLVSHFTNRQPSSPIVVSAPPPAPAFNIMGPIPPMNFNIPSNVKGNAEPKRVEDVPQTTKHSAAVPEGGSHKRHGAASDRSSGRPAIKPITEKVGEPMQLVPTGGTPASAATNAEDNLTKTPDAEPPSVRRTFRTWLIKAAKLPVTLWGNVDNKLDNPPRPPAPIGLPLADHQFL
jgi:hypothetical protein